MVIATIHQFMESLQHTLGFVMVMVALGLLYSLTALFGRYFSSLDAAKSRKAAAARAASPAPEVEAGVSDEEIAAIAACAALFMGQRSRVVSIRSSVPKDWNREGRREHFASHRIR